MTQAQIIRFCEKHPVWLRQERYATFFLTKVYSEYFVVRVNMHVYSPFGIISLSLEFFELISISS
jgi:hypothetical protein